MITDGYDIFWRPPALERILRTYPAAVNWFSRRRNYFFPMREPTTFTATTATKGGTGMSMDTGRPAHRRIWALAAVFLLADK